MISKKLYNFFRNTRSKYIVGLNKWIYGASFKCGENLYVRKGFVITLEDGNIVIGDNVFFNNNCSLNSLCSISIGDHCIFGENVHIYDHNHIYSDFNKPINDQGFTTEPVEIGKNCWFGSNVVILKGVTIGDNCVVGANCVIHENIPEGSVVINSQNQILKDRKQ